MSIIGVPQATAVYCAVSDLSAPSEDLIQLTDDDGTGVIDTTKIDLAITQAGYLIDGYLRGRYNLPLSPVPGLLTTLAAVITLRRLYSRRPAVPVPESLADDYKNALKVLENIQKGTISMGTRTPESTVTNPSPGGGGLVSTSERVFSRDAMKSF